MTSETLVAAAEFQVAKLLIQSSCLLSSRRGRCRKLQWCKAAGLERGADVISSVIHHAGDHVCWNSVMVMGNYFQGTIFSIPGHFGQFHASSFVGTAWERLSSKATST